MNRLAPPLRPVIVWFEETYKTVRDDWVDCCPTVDINGKIRSPLDQRILPSTSPWAQNLKRTMILPLCAVPLLAATDDTQIELDNFSDDRSTASNTDGNDGDDNNRQEDDGEDGSVGIIYARVSSHKQVSDTDGDDSEGGHNEGSLAGQIEELREIADRNGIELPYDPIVDKAESGTDFDRDGIQELFERAKRKHIDYVLVEKVDRIGRCAPETLYFLYILQTECDVTLLTASGPKDIDENEGLMQTTLMSLMADIQNNIRVSKANKERVRGFLRQKNWDCKTRVTPLGYEQTEDGWLVVDPEEKPIARDMFRKFAACETYAETERYIDKEYGEEYLNGKNVKTLLQYSVYIGKPQLPEHWLEETVFENDLHEPELHLLNKEDDPEVDVDEDIFHQVQDIIEEKSSSNEDPMDLLDFIEEFSLFAAIEGSDVARLVHECGEPLVKDGQVNLKGNYSGHRYRCRNCEKEVDPEEYYRQWPRQYELDKIELIQRVLDDDAPEFLSGE